MELQNVFGQMRALDTAQSPASMLPLLLIYAVLFGAIYFFFFRPQNKKKKREEAMKKNVQVGDEITTIGGIAGRIIAIKTESDKAGADSLIIETGSDRTRMRVKRWAIGSVESIHEDEE